MTQRPPIVGSGDVGKIAPRVLGPEDGDILGAVTAVRDRFLIEATRSHGGFALLEHLMPPRSLAAPLLRHSREDEFSFVLEGRVGVHFDGVESFARVGDLIFKPRGEWHNGLERSRCACSDSGNHLSKRIRAGIP